MCGFCDKYENVVIPIHDAQYRKYYINYCPMCGEKIDHARRLLEYITGSKDGREYVEIDGERLEVVRQNTGAKPRDLDIDLDNIDISRELELLDQHHIRNGAVKIECLGRVFYTNPGENNKQEK